MVACLTLTAFTSAVIVPPPLHASLNFNDINFGIKIEKIFEKGETNKIVGYMFDFKSEVEQYSGQKIDINSQLDEVQKQAKANGNKISDKPIKQIKKDFQHHDKKHKHRAVWFAQCAEVNIPYTMEEADIHFEMNDMMAVKAANKPHEQQEDVPALVMVCNCVSLWFIPLFSSFARLSICWWMVTEYWI